MAFQQGLSGLATASKALDAISNNVSNSGTVGYKQSTAQFADVFAASLVGGSSQVGIGAAVGTVAQQFTQGNINTSSNPLDLAINGQGFFQMQSADGTETYSRNGQFQTDKSGYIVNAQGLRLTGKVADANGLITDTTGPLKLNTTQAAPQSTSKAGYGLNFDSRSATPSSLTAAKATTTGTITFPTAVAPFTAGDTLTFTVDNNAPAINVAIPASMQGKIYQDAQSLVTDLQAAVDSTGLKGRLTVSATGAGAIVYTSTGTGRLSNMVVAGTPAAFSGVTVTAGNSGNFSINDPASYTSSTSQTVYDSLGNPHTQTLYFVKTAQANVWDVYSSLDGVMPKPVVVTGPPASNDYRLATLTFNQSGGLTSLSTPAATGVDVVAANLSVTPQYDLFNGAATALQFAVDFKGTTQFGSNFSVDQLTQDGYAPGQLSGLTIDANGIIQGNFTNGRSKNMGQIQLVNFANPNGLRSLGGNQWTVTAAAGQVTPGTPGSGVLGVIQSGAVEESNVDLTAELVNMITQQRSYQANAQSIKTQDQVLQTLVNLR